MTAETATIVVAGVGAWGTVMAAVLHRTNGSGPLAKKLDHLIDRVNCIDNRVSRIEGKLERD